MNRRFVVLGLAVLVSSAGTPPTVQQSQPQLAEPQGVISGQVIDGATGEPIAGATVGLLLSRPPMTQAEREIAIRDPTKRHLSVTQQADEKGFFEYSGLAPGRYSGPVQSPGYLIGQIEDSKERPDFSIPALPIELGPNEQLRNLRIRIWRAGRIAGVALDESGDPVVKATVQSFKRAYVRGRLTWSAGRTSSTASWPTSPISTISLPE